MIILLIFISFSGFAQKITSKGIDLKVLSKLAINHLNEIPPNNNNLEEKVQKLNLNFKMIDQLSRSEIFEIAITNKLLLNSQLDNEIKTLTTSLIKQTQEKLKTNETILTNFSKELMNRVIDDYLEYFEEGFINRYQSFSRNNPQEVKKYRQLKSKLKLTSSWIHRFLDLNAKDFNTLCTLVIMEAIDLSIDESYYLGQFTRQSPSNIETFELVSKIIVKDPPKSPETLKSAVDKVDDNILESASEEIDSLNTDK